MTTQLSPLTSRLLLRKSIMKPRLLATDSDPLLLGIYRTYFPRFGFDVVTAGDGLQCVRLLREFAPDALILSLELLWGGGDGVLSCFRDGGRMRPLPVVLTINGLDPAKADRLLAPPVVKMLEKPFRLRDLRASVEAGLHGSMVRQVIRATDLAPSHDSHARGDGGVDQSALDSFSNPEEMRHVERTG
jgi:DNA-binding response OmpR family regulator